MTAPTSPVLRHGPVTEREAYERHARDCGFEYPPANLSLKEWGWQLWCAAREIAQPATQQSEWAKDSDEQMGCAQQSSSPSPLPVDGLAPCPFCGHEPLLDNEKGRWTVMCVKTACGLEPCAIGNSREEVVSKWNARQSAVDALEAAKVEIAGLRAALEPFALISSEGVVKQKSGHVKLMTCAEYFHRAAQALAAHAKQKEPG